MAVDFMMSVRNVRQGRFVAEVGMTRFLEVPDGADPDPKQAIQSAAWYRKVVQAGAWTNDRGEARGDIVFIVHGYNESAKEVVDRHRRLRDGLAALAFKGTLVSFDWPSDDSTLAYLPDRHRAKQSAMRLVDDGIRELSARQLPDCPINIHVLGHSTGAYVIREAFDDADDTQLRQSSWLVSQILFAAGDVSAGSMSAADRGAESVYRHCVRLTNYSSRHDSALDLSNVKRLGVAPRVGRVGLPDGAPPIAVNVDCSDYYAILVGSAPLQQADQPAGFAGAQSHSWYFGNRAFTKDLFDTVIGIENTPRATRETGPDGRLRMRSPA